MLSQGYARSRKARASGTAAPPEKRTYKSGTTQPDKAETSELHAKEQQEKQNWKPEVLVRTHEDTQMKPSGQAPDITAAMEKTPTLNFVPTPHVPRPALLKRALPNQKRRGTHLLSTKETKNENEKRNRVSPSSAPSAHHIPRGNP